MDENSEDIPNLRDIYLWNDGNPDEKTIPMPWTQVYKTIFFANSVIADAESKAGKNETVNQIRGEAHLMRAYCHFELLNLYAKPYNKATAATDKGIPISTSIDIEQKYVSSPVEKVYSQIFADVAAAKKLLNKASFDAGYNYRFTTRSLAAFEARIYLYRGEWDKALTAAETGLQLNSTLEDLNDAASKSPSHYQSKESIQAMENTMNSIVTRTSFISPHLIGIYSAGNDLRLAKYFANNGSNYSSAKGNGPEFKVSFRNGELYLIKAEAAARTGKDAIAREALLALEVKRLIPTYFTTQKQLIDGLSGENLVNEILKERERELALEGHRWYDLRRTDQIEIKHTALEKNATLIKNDPRYTIRVPKEALVNNPDL
ncbi:SusD family protein [compost metagenome]